MRKLALLFSLLSALAPGIAATAGWPTDPRLSGNAFLPPGLQALQRDAANSPVALGLDQGQALWADSSAGPSCQSCHGTLASMARAAPTFPRLAADGRTLRNLEDQVIACRARGGHRGDKLESPDVLALSAALHQAAQGQAIGLQPPAGQEAAWQAHLGRGAQLYTTRIGRINLACVHCHDQSIGRQMRADVISPGNPTGFPIYRMSWQGLGSVDRRLRACYSGVQAVIPPPGDPDLRDLELYLKVRANGLPVDGPSVRR